MDSEIPYSLPDTVPGMTLPDVVLFPQATIPLFIFEPRYRKMLAQVLDGNHLMLLATQDQERALNEDTFEPYHPAATLGLVQSCQKNPDGTSSILVQGLIRVNAETTYQEDPFRIFSIHPLPSEPGASPLELEQHANHLNALVQRRSEVGSKLSKEILRFFDRIDDPEILVDIVAHTLVPKTEMKLQLLRSLVITKRYELLFDYLTKEIQELELSDKLKGKLDEDRIGWN
ncbi:MAG: LON peptidase substrate-binding domain-containing protein [Puniceicoccales bacterium]